MPEYASFRVSLQSQYDAATIPESSSQVTTVPAPSLRALHCESPALREQHPDKTFDDFQRGRQHTGVVVETTVPVLKGSQFWICYSCPPPPPTAPSSDCSGEEGDVVGEEEGESECARERVRYYYFKLFVSGKCLLSWGVDEREYWKGKAIFGLFDGGRDFEGRRIVEKRGLFFPSESNGARGATGEGFEIRVFRAKARRRESSRYLGLGETLGAGGGVKKGPGLKLTNVGRMHRGERQRFYSYALIDAKEEPYLVFRYRFEQEVEGESGLRLETESWMSQTDEKTEEETAIESTMLSTELEHITTTINSDLQVADDPVPDAAESSLWSDLEQNTPPQPQQNLSTPTVSNDKTTRRLSFPPRNPLLPSTSRIEPSSPIKQLASVSDDDLTRSRGQDAHYSTSKTAEMPRRTGLRKEGWTVRAASPEKGRENDEQSWQVHKKAGAGSASSTSGGRLKSVVASALRRREKEERVR